MEEFLLLLDQSPIKSIQSGVSSGAGSIVINEVDITKVMVLSRSKASAGTVATNSTIPAHHVHGVTSTNTSKTVYVDDTYAYNGLQADAVALTGGTTDLTVKEYSARLTDVDELTVDGPCEWQVIEFV